MIRSFVRASPATRDILPSQKYSILPTHFSIQIPVDSLLHYLFSLNIIFLFFFHFSLSSSNCDSKPKPHGRPLQLSLPPLNQTHSTQAAERRIGRLKLWVLAHLYAIKALLPTLDVYKIVGLQNPSAHPMNSLGKTTC
jgi:hypothetical protein